MSHHTVFKLDISDNEAMAGVRQEIEASTAQLTRAMRRALTKTARWLQSQSVKALAQEKNLPQKLLRRRLSLLSAKRHPSSQGLVAYLVANLVGVRASDLGALRQTAAGAKAGSRLFKGSFVATMPHGHRGVYRRKTRQPLPIQEQRVSLEPVASTLILALLNEQAMAHFQRVFDHELTFATRIETAHASHARGHGR